MKKTIILISILVLAIGGLFYWYELRPFFAYRKCGEETREYFNRVIGEVSTTPQANSLTNITELKFFNCINRKGIK